MLFRSDPVTTPSAVRFDTIGYDQVLRENLRIMDTTAISMCREGKLPIVVFNYKIDGNIERAIAGDAIGTVIGELGSAG